MLSPLGETQSNVFFWGAFAKACDGALREGQTPRNFLLGVQEARFCSSPD